MKKRFIFEQNGNYHTVIDTVEEVPLIMLEFKENEFGAYACFHRIIDMLNQYYMGNEFLRKSVNRQQSSNEECSKYIEEVVRQNNQLKRDKDRLIGYLFRYKGLDKDDVDDFILNQENLDEWGELYYDDDAIYD